MAELSYDKLVKFLKSNPEASQRAAAENQGLTIGQVSMLAFCQAKVEAGVESKAPATGPSVKKLRDIEENRWELIAARTGLSVAAVKDMYAEAGGKNLTGRVNGHTTSTAKSTGKKSTPAKTTGKRPQTGKAAAQSGRRQIQRNRTRRGSGNPS